MGYDLKVLNNPKPPTTVAATTQSTGPMDLSSGLVLDIKCHFHVKKNILILSI